jgi:YD repeat-containing protein
MKIAPQLATILLIACLFNNTSGQNLTPKSVASPEVASLGKFDEMPIGTYTGVPDISIPLYTIEEDGVDIPLVLRYHAGGIHVEQEATWVGLGWDLSVGGSVTQIINELPDQETSYFDGGTYNSLLSFGQTIDTIPLSQIKAKTFCHNDDVCSNGTMTFQGILTLKEHGWASPDRYTFSLPNGNGEFYLSQSLDQYQTPVQSGGESGRFFIKRSATTLGSRLAWTIQDTKGNLFYFNDEDYESSMPEVGGSQFNGQTSKLTYIKTPDGNLINFDYVKGLNYTGTYTCTIGYNFKEGKQDGPFNSIYGNVFNTKYLNKIETEKERVEFELSETAEDRLDLRSDYLFDATQNANVYGAKRINAIHIFDKISGKKIKSILFTYDYFDSDLSFAGTNSSVTTFLTKRLKLVSIKQIGYKANGDPEVGAVHSFEYNSTLLPRKDSYARDHWGLFNGRNNTSFLPDLSDEILSGIFPNYNHFYETPSYVLDWFRQNGSANKGMSPEHAQAGLIKKIIYPTKGFSTYEFEPNQYHNVRIFSASENENDVGHHVVRIGDHNTAQDVVRSDELTPEYNTLKLSDFRVTFTRTNHTEQEIPDISFINCWAKIFRVGDPQPVHTWNLTLDYGDHYKGWVSGPEYVTVNGLPSDRYYVEVYLEDIPILSPVTPQSQPAATVDVSFSYRDPLDNTYDKESIGGGLRVKSITSVDGLTNTSSQTIYSYLNDDGTTAGKLMSPIRNHVYQQYLYGPTAIPIDIVQLASYSYTPLAYDAQGAVVGYSRVEISKTGTQGDLGKTVNYYRNKPSSVFPYSSFGSFKKSIANIPYYDNGLIDSTVVYNSYDEKVKKTINGYSSIENIKTYSIQVFDVLYSPEVTDSPCGCTAPGTSTDSPLLRWCNDPALKLDLKPAQRNEDKNQDGQPDGNGRYITKWEWCNSDGPIQHPIVFDKWLAVFLPIKTKWYVQSSATEISYNTWGEQLSSKSTLQYNAIGQVVTQERTASDKSVRVSNHVYPFDKTGTDNLLQSMKSKKMYNLLLEESETVNNSEVSKTQNNYQTIASNSIKLLNVKKSFNAAPLVDELSNVKYDVKGNILQFEKDGITTSYLWGYNKQYPIAKIENAGSVIITTDDTPARPLSVLKTASAPEYYHLDFYIGRPGDAHFSISPSGAPNTSEAARVYCSVTGTNETGLFYSQSFDLCLATGSLVSACPNNGQGMTLNLQPGQYTLSAIISYENNVNVGSGRIITVGYPDVDVSTAGTEFYFQNFEEEENGVEGSAHTGKKYGTANSISWTRPNNRDYIISYWYIDNGIWKYSGRKDYTSDSFTLVPSIAYDDIRIHPKDAQMTNYTFEPLVGMSSEIDPGGITTYYEYDGLSRLKVIRDSKGNIIKNYSYHFKQ